MNKQARIKFLKSINQPIIKQADIGDFLSSHFSTLIDRNHPYQSILNIVGTGVVTGVFGPAWGALSAILDQAGINLSSILSTLKNTLSSFFATNPTISNDNVDSVADQLAKQTIQSSNVSQEALQSGLEQKANANYDLQKTAGLLDAVTNNWVLRTLFTGAAKRSFGGFLFGLLFTIIKALLIGGGLTLGAGYIASKIRGENPQQTQQNQQTQGQPQQTQVQEQSQVPAKKETTLLQYLQAKMSPSGKGEIIHKNDADQNNKGDYAWYVPTNGNVSKTIYNWIFDIYPDISDEVETVIYDNYNKVITPLLNTIQKWNPENINQLPEVRIPNNFISRKQIVDYVLSSFILQ